MSTILIIPIHILISNHNCQMTKCFFSSLCLWMSRFATSQMYDCGSVDLSLCSICPSERQEVSCLLLATTLSQCHFYNLHPKMHLVHATHNWQKLRLRIKKSLVFSHSDPHNMFLIVSKRMGKQKPGLWRFLDYLIKRETSSYTVKMRLTKTLFRTHGKDSKIWQRKSQFPQLKENTVFSAMCDLTTSDALRY